MPGQALEGVRVVEFCDEIGSYCGRLLAGLGADVIKVEPPGGGRQRHTPPFFQAGPRGPDASLTFWAHNTSKRSVVLNLQTQRGREDALRLALSADVFLEDCPVGYLEAHGLGYAALHGAKPSLVYTSMTGFGQTGPHARWAYADIVGQAMSGIVTLAGSPQAPPYQIYGNQANLSASIHGAQGTLLAVLHAEATGQGQQVDVSAQEATAMAQETAMQFWDLQKKNRFRTGFSGGVPVTLPAMGVYPTSDGWVMTFILSPAGADLPGLIDWMRERGFVEDLDQEPYASLIGRLNMAYITPVLADPHALDDELPEMHHIHDVVAKFLQSMTAREAYEGGQRRHLLVGIVSTPKDLAEDSQLRARNWFRPVTFDYLNRTFEFPGPPFKLSDTPMRITRPPRLGEHTAAVLAELAAGSPR
jgi:crotonobetainyl-CoA:carnitine CoA-transferase CaiB-like acyl-CoA transferase